MYELAASRWSAPALASTPAIADPSPLGPLDRAADTLGLALAAFDVRGQLFERRQMGCAELARGLVEVEERWIGYNAARRSEEHTSELQSPCNLVCRLLLEKKKKILL